MKFHHIAITVKNIEESVEFYSKLFDFEIITNFERPDLDGKATFLRCEEVGLELWEFNKNQNSNYLGKELQDFGITHIAFQVDSIEDFIERSSLTLASEIQTGASGGRYIFIKDPTGNSVELYTPPEVLKM